MGKLPYMFTDSDETEGTSSSVENVKKKKKLSILRFGSIRKKKCKLQSKSEPNDSDYSTISSHKISRLRGILKNSKQYRSEDDDDDETESLKSVKSRDKCLVGRVPRPAGAKPGRGGGFSIVIRKNASSLQQQGSSASSTRRRLKNRLVRKKSC